MCGCKVTLPARTPGPFQIPRPQRPRPVDPHLPRGVRANPAPGGAAARLPLELHDLRPGRPDPPGEAVPGGAGAGPEAIHPTRNPQSDLACEGPPDPAGGVCKSGAILLRPDGRRRVPALPAPS